MDNLMNEAISFAVEKHKNQKRKGIAWPYIVHIYDVMQILYENGADTETIIAGILHDTVEDTDTTLDEIESKFGANIKEYVEAVTEDKSLPYMERKHLKALKLKTSSRNAKMVKCADCLSNLRSTQIEMKYQENFWSKFNSGKENINTYYRENIEVMAELEGLEMYEQLKNKFSKIFGDRLIERRVHDCEIDEEFTQDCKNRNTILQQKDCSECTNIEIENCVEQ